MLRMGATEEGVLRKHGITYSGRYRDTIYYSVLDTEWPAVRDRLLGFLER
jgi:RimJ/RimL family protein N-acetyltransferase